MAIVSFIETRAKRESPSDARRNDGSEPAGRVSGNRDQADVIEKILKHCGLWHQPASRAPPKTTGPPVQPVLDLSYVDADEYLMAL